MSTIPAAQRVDPKLAVVIAGLVIACIVGNLILPRWLNDHDFYEWRSSMVGIWVAQTVLFTLWVVLGPFRVGDRVVIAAVCWIIVRIAAYCGFPTGSRIFPQEVAAFTGAELVFIASLSTTLADLRSSLGWRLVFGND